MAARIVKVFVWGGLVGLLFLLPGSALGELSVRLSEVPRSLCFPLPEGVNQVLTVKVLGGEAKQVWLTPAKDKRVRIMLTGTGDGEYQINLADPVVRAVFQAVEGEGEFQVFAESKDGQVAASIPVRYFVEDTFVPADVEVSFFVHVGGKRKEVADLQRPEGWDELARLTGPRSVPSMALEAALRAQEGQKHWYSPQQVDRVEVELDKQLARIAARAEADGKDWAFQSGDTARTLQLEITDEIRKAWENQGNLVLRCTRAGDLLARCALNAPPRRLDLPEETVRITIVQRHSKELPGSRGYALMYLGDITGRQVLVSITGADRKVILDTTSVRRGDEVDFALPEERYKLSVVRLVNHIFGDDWGIFTITRLKPSEQAGVELERQKIQRLITALEEADVTFIRNQKEYTASEGAAHIRQKYRTVQQKLLSVEQFIENVATRSSATGKDYLIKLPDGSTVKAGDWLREQADKLDEKTERESQPE